MYAESACEADDEHFMPMYEQSNCEDDDERSSFSECRSVVKADDSQPSSTRSPTLVNVRYSEESGEPGGALMNAESTRELIARTPTLEDEILQPLLVVKGHSDQPVPCSNKSNSQDHFNHRSDRPLNEDSFIAKHRIQLDKISFKHHLSGVEADEFLKGYLAEDPSEAPWTIFHLRVSAK